MVTDQRRALRDAFGAFLTGVTVVTTHDSDGAPLGFTANSFTSVSLEPPLLLVCLANSSVNYDAIIHAPGFAINILAESQKEVSNTFASPVEDRFATVSWSKGPYGSPVLDDVAAWFDCSMHKAVDAGDHTILIGKVEEFATGTASGLGYSRGAYFSPTLGTQAATNTQVVVGVVIEREGKVLLEEDQQGYLCLPRRKVEEGVTSAALANLLAEIKLQASIDFLYALYEDQEKGEQYMVYHCSSATGEIGLGQFYDLNEETIDRLADKPTRVMLTRLKKENSVGNYGTYFGNKERGEVRQISAGK